MCRSVWCASSTGSASNSPNLPSPRVGGREADSDLTAFKERKEAMAIGKVRDGKPYAEKPYIRFDGGEVASAIPKRGSLFYKIKLMKRLALSGLVILSLSALGADPKWSDFETVDDQPDVMERTAAFAVDAFCLSWDESIQTLSTVGLGQPGFMLFFR